MNDVYTEPDQLHVNSVLTQDTAEAQCYITVYSAGPMLTFSY